MALSLKRVGALVAVTAFMIGTAACSSRTDGEATGAVAPTTVERFAVVTPENESDHGWNQAGLAGAEGAATELGIAVDLLPDAGWDNTETVLAQLAEGDAQFIIAHASGYSVAAQSVAESTGVPILVHDTGDLIPGKLAKITTEAQQGGYLAGIAAAMSTASKKVGIVVSADSSNWFKMASGFAEGVYSVDPTIEVLFASIGPAEYADSAGGKATAEQLIAAGADVLFGMGDGATTGYLQAVEAAPQVLYIADIGDVTDVIDPQRVLTSVLWNYQATYVEAIGDVEAGKFGTHDYVLTVGNGGLTLQDSPNLTPEILAAVEEARSAITAGDITPAAAATAEELRAVLAAR